MALSHSTKDLTGRGPHRHKPATKKKKRAGARKKITHTRVHTSRFTHIAYSPASDGRRRPQWTAASLDILPHQCRHWPLLRHEGNTRCKRLATVASTPADVKSYVTCPRAWGAAGAACGSRGRLNSDDLKTGEAIRHDCCAGRRQADEKKLWRKGDEVSCQLYCSRKPCGKWQVVGLRQPFVWPGTVSLSVCHVCVCVWHDHGRALLRFIAIRKLRSEGEKAGLESVSLDSLLHHSRESILFRQYFFY